MNKQLAELALLSFLKVIIEIQVNKKIVAFNKNKILQQKIKNFKVNMGFGLHVGWAIEGAIGSSYKIDASYLSPNVNLTSRLEAATRQFGVDILFSGKIHDMLTTKKIKDYCRHVDTVTVKGSINPMRFYTIDYNLQNLRVRRQVAPSFSNLSKVKKELMTQI